MKPRLLAFLTIAAPLALTSQARAAAYFWNPTASATPANYGGSGNWDNVTASWWTGTAAVAWPGPANDATFAGVTGTVTLGEPVAANSLAFTTTGYTLTNGGTAANTLTLAAPAVNTNANTATLDTVIAGTAGLTKSGTGILILSRPNTYTGNTTIAAGTLRTGINGAFGTTPLVFSAAGTLDIGATTQTLPTLKFSANAVSSVTGTGGTLNLSAGSAFNPFNYSVSASATLNMGALDTFTCGSDSSTTADSFTIGQLSGGSSTSTTTLTLAKTSTISTGTAGSVLIGTSGTNSGSTTAPFGTVKVNLGQATAIHSNSITIGGATSFATVGFTSGLTGTPALTIRGADGSSRATTVIIGINSSNYRPAMGMLDLTGTSTGGSGVAGTLDALIGNLTIGSVISTQLNAVGTLQMGAGTLDASSITVGSLTGSSASPTATGTLSVNGGTVKTPTLTIGTRSGTFINGVTGTVVLNGAAVLKAKAITAGTNGGATNLPVRTFTWNSGTLQNLDTFSLGVTGLTLTLPIHSTGQRLVVEAGQTATFGTGSALSFTYDSVLKTCPGIQAAGAAVVLSGASLALADPAPAPLPDGTKFTLLDYTGGSLSGTFTGLAEGANVTVGTQVFVIHYNDSSKITLSVVVPSRPLTWTGSAGGNWDLGTTASWTDGTAATLYNLSDAPTFDDTAPGTTSLVLNASVIPAAVTFNNEVLNYSLTGSGAITGNGTFTKTGDGTVVIATNNTHTGLNTITGGTVRIGDGGTSGLLGTGKIDNLGTLVFDRSDTFVFPNVITNGGNVTQAGTGTVILTADSDYFGLTTINAGSTLQLGNGGATGSLSGTFNVDNEGTLVFAGSSSKTLAAGIYGDGAVTIGGTGTLILTAENTYTGGTTITSGTLQLGAGISGGSVTGAITDNANLTLNRSDSYELANPIGGSGTVTFAGSGIYRLTGTNTYAGETRVVGGTLSLDGASHLPAGGAFAFTGATGTLSLSGGDLSLSGLRAVASVTGTPAITGSASLAVTAADLLVGTTGTSTVTLDLTGLPSFTYNVPGGTISIGNQAAASASNAYLKLAPASTLTAAALNLQTTNSATITDTTTAGSTGNLHLGTVSTAINAGAINIGTSGRDGGSIAYAAGAGAANPTLTLRATDGTGRTNITLGARGTAYGTNSTVAIDLVTNVSGSSTLDALVGSLKIGVHSRGSGQTETANFLMGGGTLDATSIEVGNMSNTVASTTSTLAATFGVTGGTVITPALTLGTQAQSVLISTINLNGGATLRTKTLAAGTGTGTRKFNWNSGTLANLAGTDLTVTGIPFYLPAIGSRMLAVESGHTATFGSGTVFNLAYDSSTLAAGGVNASGSAIILSGAAVAVTDSAATPAAVPGGTKLVLLNYTGGSLTGTFNGLAEGAGVTIGSNSFVLHYADTLGGTGLAVTLVSSNATDAYGAWLATYPALVNPADQTKDADPDHDGRNNLGEFAFNGDPTSASNDGKVAGKVAVIGSDHVLTFTLPVRTGAVFTAPASTEQVSSVIDGLYYHIQGSANLAAFDLAITEVTGADAMAIQAGMPSLSSGWTYRTFRAPGSMAATPGAFLRAKVTDAP